MAADTLVLKDQAMSIQTADWKSIIFDQFHQNITCIVNDITKWNYSLQKKYSFI